MKYAVVFSMVSSREEAERIAFSILSDKLAACVNIVPKVDSIYWWKGMIERNTELMLIMKTRKTNVFKVISKIKELHSYEVPEIISLDISSGNGSYLKWIADTVNVK